jgi:serine phosphatase RsbU (regulator of sigma subunit)
MCCLTFIELRVALFPVELANEGLFRFLFLIVVVIAFSYIVVWGQTRSLMKAHRLLREKEDALDEVARQREELARKNKNITDSLIYAKKIQEALIPSPTFFGKHFSESFILFKPRDIVSGDFYYISEKRGRIFIVVADCTGHGVPGALMSMIGLQTIDRIISMGDILHPSSVLDRLNMEIESAFHREDDYSQAIKDGMDIAICCIDRKAARVEYAGAFLPLYIIRDGKLMEFRGDKFIIGRRISGQIYTNHELVLEDGDIFYMMSDGYADQFGGIEDKKFMNRRLRYLLVTIHKYSMGDQMEILADNFVQWKGNNDQVDDIMVIGFRP